MPSANIKDQQLSYRRGVVLGLTMAEIMTLVIFALLLVMTALTLARQKRIVALQGKLDALHHFVAAVDPAGYDPPKIDDILHDMEIARNEARSATAEQARLAEAKKRQDQALQASQAALAKETAQLAEVQATNQKMTDFLDPKGALRRDKLPAYVAAGAALYAALAQDGKSADDPGAVETAIKRMVDNQAAINRRLADEAAIANLRGQIANLQVALKSNGSIGTVFPPCWAMPGSGKPEYIFDVAITSDGFVVRDNAIPGRAAEQARLPIQEMKFGHKVTRDAFLAETRGILEWSKKQKPECRFFVRLFDRTGDAEKSLFKKGLLTVEAPFYKYLMDSAAGAPG